MIKVKRVFLVFTLGVLFAPSVFANSGPFKASHCGTGELNADCMNYTATQCQIAQVIKEAESGSSQNSAHGKVGAAK